MNPARQSPANFNVLALVSGLPTLARQNRALVMWQAFLDDSGQGQGPVLVLAGFISTADRWMALADEWQEALSEIDPAIKYFKMSEAMSLSGEFSGWSKPRRDERVMRFYRIIEAHCAAAIWTAIPKEAYERIFAPAFGLYPIYKNPYYLLLFSLISQFSKDRDKIGITDRVDFVFDDQMNEKRLVVEAWDFFKSEQADPRLLEIMGDVPSFRDDQRVLPLQAADIHAWWVRRLAEQKITGVKRQRPPFKSDKSMPLLSFEWTEQTLRRTFNTMFEPDIRRMELLFNLGLWPATSPARSS